MLTYGFFFQQILSCLRMLKFKNRSRQLNLKIGTNATTLRSELDPICSDFLILLTIFSIYREAHIAGTLMNQKAHFVAYCKQIRIRNKKCLKINTVCKNITGGLHEKTNTHFQNYTM